MVLILTGALLLYWLVMFLVSYAHDSEIQKERSIRLESQIKNLMARWEFIEKRRTEPGGKSSHDYGEVKSYIDALNAQRERTARATLYGGMITKLELYIPILLTLVASVILGAGVYDAH